MKTSTSTTKPINKIPFTLYRRKTATTNPGVFYVQFKTPNSKRYYTTAKSTGTTNKTEAMMTAWQWYSNGNIPDRINAKISTNHSRQLETVITALKNGDFKQNELEQIMKTLEQVYSIKGGVIPDTSASIKIKDYFTEFWDPAKSPYLKEQRMSGKQMHNGHIKMMQQIITNFWIPKFGEREIGSFTKKELQEWLWNMKESQFEIGQKDKKMAPLSHSYLNRIVSAGLRAFKYAYENKFIFNDCFTGFTYLQLNAKRRKIITREQAKTLFHRDWTHKGAKLGNQVAMLTGLRLGEILALKLCDLGDDKIYIRHNYAVHDGLKCPKNGKERSVPANPELLNALRKQAKTNPYKQGDQGFIFWSSTQPNKPFDNKIWREQLKQELKKIGVKDYNDITFHSWRHFFSTYIEPYLNHSDLQKVTGHLTEKMLEHYADHQNDVALQKVNKVVEDVLLPLSGFEE
ncbi:MAG: hypothetical protein BKP49_10435 [Treponema sp. CETP13]|nr:MAG: hypothetical protein BKP49_10435 [Treponema sp. CETP13]